MSRRDSKREVLKESTAVRIQVLGIIGGAVGGWLFSLLGITAGGILGQLVVAVIGAVIVLWAFAKLK